MTASMGEVVHGKYTAVLYSCYFTKSRFELRSLNVALAKFVVLAGIRLDKKFRWLCEYI